ncbi:hypothetical protein ABCS69_000807 [Providencia stuartii]|uniref:Uncharacterized protein n=2 Tax=Providencia TaxID=586 RepID=A0AAI9HYH7_PROST|nr:hypothetical protein [Providencia stuartii]ELR5046027.1 hypothetical protein [Providencia rettgeri]MTB38437.1 hypothetical protein [Providencia sp. wls1949]MTC06573.1 hypothetical protein [Providencia sp. wls1948]QIC17838.1 hypothetical protein G3341_12125 [Providencia vermicola]
MLMCLLLFACTSKWEPVGLSEWTYQEADSQCEFDAFKRFPVRNEVAQHTVYETISKKCKKDDECGKEKTYEEKVPKTESYVLDVNKESRRQEYVRCMKRKGWQEKNDYFWQS